MLETVTLVDLKYPKYTTSQIVYWQGKPVRIAGIRYDARAGSFQYSIFEIERPKAPSAAFTGTWVSETSLLRPGWEYEAPKRRDS